MGNRKRLLVNRGKYRRQSFQSCWKQKPDSFHSQASTSALTRMSKHPPSCLHPAPSEYHMVGIVEVRQKGS